MASIPIDTNLAAGLIALRIAILFALIYALAVVLTFEFVPRGSRRFYLIAGFFVSAFLAALLERIV
jgi:hypothetical protein